MKKDRRRIGGREKRGQMISNEGLVVTGIGRYLNRKVLG